MGRTWQKWRKFRTLAVANLSSYFTGTPAFVRIIPTDRCNLSCTYCWQHDQASADMTFDEFVTCLKHAIRLRVGLITFLGGEPMLWEPLTNAIAACSQHGILTDMTTNGSRLDASTLDAIGQAGLDYLNVSVDGLQDSEVSKKSAASREGMIVELRRMRARYGTHFRLNAVVFRDNFEAIRQLLEFAYAQHVQVSLGFVVPPPGGETNGAERIHFTLEDEELLHKIVDHILAKKRDGYPIIDPDAYFTGVFRFLRGEKFWDCNYPTRYGWINVTAQGRVRSCTKAMDELDVRFADLDRRKVSVLREIYRQKVATCNVHCYSNCAFDSYYYTRHKSEMAKRVFTRLIRNRALPPSA